MNICIFGDSIVWGAYDAKQGGWATRLQNYFMAGNSRVCVYNLGISGGDSSRLLEQINVEAKLRKPNMIIIATGINDAVLIRPAKKPRISLSEFQQNLTKLLSIAKRFTDNVVFVGITRVNESKSTPVTWNNNVSYINEDINQLDDTVEKFCVENKLKFISMKNVVSHDGLADGVHPNTSGHIKMFEKIKAEIEPLI